MNQLELHKKIDALLIRSLAEIKPEEVSVLISANEDVHQYFYARADERWLGWLWENGFLEAIKKKADDPTRYGYRTPELNYLARIAEKVPAKVVDIILTVPVSVETFNPEVVDRFLRICSTLPAGQLERVVQKIHDEKWIPLMGAFNQWGFEYEKILKTLADAKDYKSILVLAEAILTVRTKEEVNKEGFAGVSTENFFYFKDLSYTKVFEYLTSVDNKYAELVLRLTTKMISQIVLLGGKTKEGEVFPIEETFHLFDVDFFILEPEGKKRLSHRDDVRELVAVIKVLASYLITERCANTDAVRKLYEQYIASLPQSKAMWRLRLFILSLCPEAFKNELKNAFFRLFEVKRYHELISGTEYEKALRIGFPVLSESDKREYVNQTLEYFSKHAQDKVDQKWHKRHGWEILSSICEQLTNEENEKCEKAFGRKCDATFEPEPSIKFDGFAREITPQAPDDKDWEKSASEITQKLRNEWSPRMLAEKYKDTDFHRPTGAEGAGERLKKEISKRPQEFLENAQLFFHRESLDPHYTYSFLRGVYDILREKKIGIADVRVLLLMLNEIVVSGQKKAFDAGVRERESFGGWLAGWTAVHNAMSDVTKELLNENNKSIADFVGNRDQLLKLIAYLLKHSDPKPKDEKEESTRTNYSGEVEYTGSDPFTEAINSVRGQALEALVLFIYQNGKTITDDVKRVYEELLGRENTHAVMFIFGHYLPTFYFRDKTWIRNLLPQIFMQDIAKKDLYLAAWEGLLTSNLSGEMFFDPAIAVLYSRGIKFKPDDYTKRRYFKDIDEALATHLALAFIYFQKFDFEHDLFKQFWSTENLKRHKEFISFIGRHSISREAAVEWIKYNKIDKEKLQKFWDWALEHCNPEELTGFGFWINVERSALDTKWLAQHARQTLEKTKGYVEWEYGLMRSLSAFAKETPEDTLAILRTHLLEEVAKHEPTRTWLHMDNEVFDAFKELYRNEVTKEGISTLINDLLPYRNGFFWGLKSILEGKDSNTKV